MKRNNLPNERDFVGKFIAIEVALPMAAESRKEKKCENQLFIVSSIHLKLLCYVYFCEIAVTIAYITCRRFFLENYNSTSSDATKSSMQINFIPIGARFAYFYTGKRCALAYGETKKNLLNSNTLFLYGGREMRRMSIKRDDATRVRVDQTFSQARTCEHK